jgi:hypothetical protein
MAAQNSSLKLRKAFHWDSLVNEQVTSPSIAKEELFTSQTEVNR